MSTPMSTDRESTLVSDDEKEQISGCSTYASFGDKGVTATTNSHGHLLQITRYLDQPSGFFCVDLTDILPSHPITHRMQKLQEYCTDPNSGVGVRIEHSMDVDAHTKKPNEEVSNEENSNEEVLNKENSNEEKPNKEKPNGEKPNGEKPNGEKPNGEKPNGEKPNGEKPNGEVPKLDFVHDRWPHFVTKTPKFDLETQYVVSEKTVYQIYTLKPYRGEDHPAEIPHPDINIELFLRNLSVKADSDENISNSNNNDTQGSHYEEYSNHLSPENDCVKRTRNIRNTEHGNRDVIALFITPFINKRPQKFHLEPKSGDCRIILEGSVLKDFRRGSELEVTLAYRLELISSGRTEFNGSVSSESLSKPLSAPSPESLSNPISESLSDTLSEPLSESILGSISESFSEARAVLKKTFKKPSLIQDDDFNASLRRNLEHILSVCSIPVSFEANRNNPSIALTCGDISGHRISTEASFYAFRFLLLTLENINNPSRGVYQLENDSKEDDYVAKMTSRILEVCQGHLRWLIRGNEKSDSEVLSLNGTDSDATIVDDDSNPNVLKQSLISTSFQIIKAAEFCRTAMSTVSEEAKLEIAEGFRTIVSRWTAALDEKNKGRDFLFPNLRKETEQWVFHLSDHAIIWWAAKSAEDLELRIKENLAAKLAEELELGVDKDLDAKSAEELELRVDKDLAAEPTEELELRVDKNLAPKSAEELELRVDKSLAAKLAEELKLRVDKNLGTYISRDGMSYSKEIQKSLWKRFTIGNSSFEKHMIAISRSSNETRFQFRAKDTVLFYAMERRLFDQGDPAGGGSSTWENKIEAWRCTVDYQKECEDDQNAHLNWDQPLHYALALMMSSINKQITSQAISRVQKDAKNILLQRSSCNGLLSGHPDENKRSTMFDGDGTSGLFWSAAFEVPYIILKYLMAQTQSEIPGSSITATTPSPQGSSASLSLLLTESTASDPTRELVRNKTTPMSTIEIPTGWQSPLMKHGVLFNNAIDLGKIVEIPDEWLYNEPTFFNFHPTISFNTVDKFRKELRKIHAKEMSKKSPSKYQESSSMANIKGLLEKETHEKITSEPNTEPEAIRRNQTALCTMKVVHGAAAMADLCLREGEPMGCIIDVPRVRRHKEKKEYVSVSISSSVSLINHLGTRRTPSVAKKRIFHFSRASWNIALVCYFASSEREEISDFFDRHALSSPYFFEDTMGTLNKWVTELHLPFYQISSSKKSLGHIRSVPDADKRDTIPEPKIIQLPYSDTKGTTGRKAVAKTLSRAVISFRFDGDLLDRYWTCHLIEYTPQQMDGPNEMSFDIPTQPISGALKSNPWRQRRVLELLLFDRSLREILRCTEEILDEAKSTLRAAKDTGNDGCSYEDEECKIEFSYTHDRKVKASRDVFRSNDSLYKMQEVLQEVEDSLSENLAKMQLWKNRQNGRGPEKPRWTLKDEYRYGGAISRLQASNNFYMEELVRCRAKILAFNSQLTREIDASRSDWEMRTTNNVRLFTYVTVVFLPTSFATGVFSMSGVPSIPVLRLVVITAVVALFLTIITLVNAKNLERMLRYVRDRIYQFRHGLRHYYYGLEQSISETRKLIRQIILESGLAMVNFFLLWLHMTYKWANEHHASAQERRPISVRYILKSILRSALDYIIYRLAFYIYIPLRKVTEGILSSAEVYDPIGKMSFNDDHPIQQARFNYSKKFDTASEVKSDSSEKGVEQLFDDLGPRDTDLFKNWQRRLKPKGDNPNTGTKTNRPNMKLSSVRSAKDFLEWLLCKLA